VNTGAIEKRHRHDRVTSTKRGLVPDQRTAESSADECSTITAWTLSAAATIQASTCATPESQTGVTRLAISTGHRRELGFAEECRPA
jgi:hypothetical protein